MTIGVEFFVCSHHYLILKSYLFCHSPLYVSDAPRAHPHACDLEMRLGRGVEKKGYTIPLFLINSKVEIKSQQLAEFGA